MNVEFHSFFSPLSESARSRLVAAAAHQIRAAGVCIFEEGAPPDSLYLLLSGEVEIRKRTPAGRTEVLARIAPNDWFGEMGVLDGCPRSASAFTVTETRLARIPADVLLAVLRSESGEGILQLFHRTSARLREMDNEFTAAAFRSDRLEILREAAGSLLRHGESARLALAGTWPPGAEPGAGAREWVRRRTADLESWTRSLADYARGSLTVNRQPVAVRDFVGDIASANAEYFRVHRVEFSTRDCAGEFRVDRERLALAVQIMLNNAVESFGAAGGTIRSEASWMPSNVQLTLADNGPGIPAEIRARVFTPFITAGKLDALGLGLSLAKAIVEAHGGNITFRTETGRGTTFVLNIPA